MLEQEGYPFKSKQHSQNVDIYQRLGETETVDRYLYPSSERQRYQCPDILLYQFTDEFDLKISDKCCDNLKKIPIKKWEKENSKPYSILGIRRSEGGYRNRANCLAFSHKKFKSFQPLVVISDEWEDWFCNKYNIQLCELYYPPYNFTRTGCKGCPFNLKLQKDLDVLEQLLPNERKQCELIWKPVYDEYRRIGYRLKKEESDE